MGIGGISGPQLLIILAIVVLLFGTKRLRGLGGDLGAAIKSFKKSVSDDNKDSAEDESPKKVASGDDATFAENAETTEKREEQSTK